MVHLLCFPEGQTPLWTPLIHVGSDGGLDQDDCSLRGTSGISEVTTAWGINALSLLGCHRTEGLSPFKANEY